MNRIDSHTGPYVVYANNKTLSVHHENDPKRPVKIKRTRGMKLVPTLTAALKAADKKLIEAQRTVHVLRLTLAQERTGERQQ